MDCGKGKIPKLALPHRSSHSVESRSLGSFSAGSVLLPSLLEGISDVWIQTGDIPNAKAYTNLLIILRKYEKVSVFRFSTAELPSCLSVMNKLHR